MFAVANTWITTISEFKKEMKKTLEASQDAPVYIIKDGKPVAAVVSIEMMEMVNEAREDRRLARIAARRLDAIEAGEDRVLGEEEFWEAVDKRRPAATER